MMGKEDARLLKMEALHERRKQVIRLHRKGIKVMQIVDMTGLSYPAVRFAIDCFEAGGMSAIKPARRGKEMGTNRVLNPEQEAQIRALICEKRPEQLKMAFALWTRAAVMQLIERECAIALKVHAVGNYLQRWGFTAQNRIKRAYEQRPEALKAWLEEAYPAIEKQTKAEGGEIHWGDETALDITDVRGRSYSPRGQTPVTMAVGGARQKLSMISTVTNQGKSSWMIIDESFNADRLIEFLGALVTDAQSRKNADGCGAPKKVFLILDNLRVQLCFPVKAWLSDKKQKIEVFSLPSDSPQHNPDERLNADLKYAIGSKVPVRTKTKLKAAATTHMQMLQSCEVILRRPALRLCRLSLVHTSLCRIISCVR